MPTLELSAGTRTEELLQYVLAQLSDDELDGIEVRRTAEEADNLATEPMTSLALLTLSTTAVVAVGRIIERWLETQRQLQAMNIVADGFRQSEEAGKALARVAEKSTAVSVQYKLAGLARGRKP